jgi:hypothetical protein
LSLFNDFFRKMHDRVTARFYPGSRLILGLENTDSFSGQHSFIRDDTRWFSDRCISVGKFDYRLIRKTVSIFVINGYAIHQKACSFNCIPANTGTNYWWNTTHALVGNRFNLESSFGYASFGWSGQVATTIEYLPKRL